MIPIWDRESHRFLNISNQTDGSLRDRDFAIVWANSFSAYAEMHVYGFTQDQIESAKRTVMNRFQHMRFSAYSFGVYFDLNFVKLCEVFASQIADMINESSAYNQIGYKPITPPDFSPVYDLGNNLKESVECLEVLAGIIDNWIRTGTTYNAQTHTFAPWTYNNTLG